MSLQAALARDRYLPGMRENECRWATGRLRALLRGRCRSLHAQAGFTLIEVLVSAALLMVVAGGVLAGIEGPSAIASKTEARSEASALAQQDQERMRGMAVSSLIGYSNTRTVTVGASTYTVLSNAVWIRDANDTNSCTVPGNSTSGDYLKISSKVTPPGTRAPVELDSLIALPPGTAASSQGDLSVQLKNQLDQPVVGQSVTMSGPPSMTVPTNSAGCAVFGLVNAGTYTISYSTVGWVDPSAVTSVSFTTSVTSGSTNLVTKNYAQSARIHATVNTSVSGTVQASNARAMTVVNAGIPAGTLTFNAANVNTGQTAFDMDLYPFPSGYGVWAGSCSSGDPTKYAQAAVTAAPGPGATANVSVRQPAVNLTLKRNNVLYASQHVRVTSTDAGCNSVVTSTTTSTGIFADPGFPYGNWTVCGDDGTNHASGPLVGTNPLGSAALALNIPIPSGGGNGGNGNGNGGNGGGTVPAANAGVCP
jgi:Tfp pilus assembly protein PilV